MLEFSLLKVEFFWPILIGSVESACCFFPNFYYISFVIEYAFSSSVGFEVYLTTKASYRSIPSFTTWTTGYPYVFCSDISSLASVHFFSSLFISYFLSWSSFILSCSSFILSCSTSFISFYYFIFSSPSSHYFCIVHIFSCFFSFHMRFVLIETLVGFFSGSWVMTALGIGLKLELGSGIEMEMEMELGMEMVLGISFKSSSDSFGHSRLMFLGLLLFYIERFGRLWENDFNYN